MTVARRGLFVRLFGSALLDQALLSASNLAIGLILIRRSDDIQYGSYVLVSSALLLLASLQHAFIAPAMVNRMAALAPAQRGALSGGLHREQRRCVVVAAVLAALVTVLAWLGTALSTGTALLLLAAIAAAPLALNREFFRMLLLACKRPTLVLIADLVYATLLLTLVLLASRSPAPALMATLALALAGALGGSVLSRLLRRHEAWDPGGEPGILRRIAPIGAWSACGALIHWLFSQGYSYLVAATLDVAAVAAIAATRLLLMPINLLSTGIGALLLPLTSGWLHTHGSALALRRLALIAAAMIVLALAYLGVLWTVRELLFAQVLQRQFPQRDALLLLWSGAFVLMVARDQLVYLLVARERFRTLTALSALSALLALLVSYLGMLRFGLIGAPLGVLTGEALNLTGILILAARERVRGAPVACAG